MEGMTAKARYAKLTSDRDPYVQRARECAKVTIPSLFPPDGTSGITKLPTPYQGVGARGLNNLASKVMLTSMPINEPLFRLQVDDFTLEEMTQQEGLRAEVEEALSRIERAVTTEIETTGIRPTVFEAMKLWLLSGSVLLYFPEDSQTCRYYRLDSYVNRRDPEGTVLEIITQENVAPSALPEDVRLMLDPQELKEDKPVELYTWINREDDQWVWHQEVGQKRVPGTDGKCPLDRCPWLSLRYGKVDGEDYGRSYVEEYLGDLKSLEACTAAMVEASAAMAKVLFFTKPNGVTRASTITKARNLDVLTGDANDITVLRVDKFSDLRVTMEVAGKMEDRLERAFLLNSAIQRAGERVTAEEIRYMAAELEDTLGGVYSLLSQEFQLPMVNALMRRMELAKRLPSLPKDTVRPTITAGISALGRGHDLAQLQTFIQALMPLAQAQPELLSTYLVPEAFLKRVGASLMMDTKGLVRTEAEVMQLRQQDQINQMMAGMAPGMLPDINNMQPQE